MLLRTDSTLTRIDAAGGVPSTVPLDGPASEIVVTPDGLWVLDDGTARAVRKVDPADGTTIGSLGLGGVPGGGAFADGSLWITVHAP